MTNKEQEIREKVFWKFIAGVSIASLIVCVLAGPLGILGCVVGGAVGYNSFCTSEIEKERNNS
jgi:hypothetical protein